MSSASEIEFETCHAGSDPVTYTEANNLKVGSLVCMQDGEYPCKVTSFKTIKNGKHGAAKAIVVASDIFTHKKFEESFGAHDNVATPIVYTTEYECIDLNNEGYFTLLTEECVLREDLRAPSKDLLDKTK